MNSASLPPDFEQQLHERTDAELSDMLDHPGDYVPGAIEAVKNELHRRRPETTTSLENGAGPRDAGAEPTGEVELAETAQDEKNLVDPALSLAIVATFRNVVDAGLFRARLEAAGIEACMPEEYTPQLFWNIIPNPLETVTVRVAAKDIEAAKALLADYTDTVFTALAPGLEQSPAETTIQQAAIGDTDPQNQKLCVSCRAPISTNAALCPKCGWTQPDSG